MPERAANVPAGEVWASPGQGQQAKRQQAVAPAKGCPGSCSCLTSQGKSAAHSQCKPGDCRALHGLLRDH